MASEIKDAVKAAWHQAASRVYLVVDGHGANSAKAQLRWGGDEKRSDGWLYVDDVDGWQRITDHEAGILLRRAVPRGAR